ncbi:MAG: alpha/beta hydrolase fold domain-containing protein [Burkholderiales bacterium]
MPTRPNRSFTAHDGAGEPLNPSWTTATLALADGSTALLRLYRGAVAAPNGAAGLPVVLHFHGGGFVGGSLDSGATVAHVLAGHAGVVASLDYPLAPAHPFPAAVEAGYRALQGLHRQHRRSPLFVAGEDAGGNIAAAVAMMARDRGGPPLAGQILLSPMLDNCIATASQRDARDGPLGCPCADGWRAYLGCVADAMHPYATPGTSLRLAGLPSTLLLTSLDDPLRDETLAYAARLHGAGVAAQVSVLPLTTGWPKSYPMGEVNGRPAHWIEPLRQRIQPFLMSPSLLSPSLLSAHTTL